MTVSDLSEGKHHFFLVPEVVTLNFYVMVRHIVKYHTFIVLSPILKDYT